MAYSRMEYSAAVRMRNLQPHIQPTILLHSETIDNNLGECHKHNIEGKKPHTKGYILFNAPYIKFKAW